MYVQTRILPSLCISRRSGFWIADSIHCSRIRLRSVRPLVCRKYCVNFTCPLVYPVSPAGRRRLARIICRSRTCLLVKYNLKCTRFEVPCTGKPFGWTRPVAPCGGEDFERRARPGRGRHPPSGAARCPGRRIRASRGPGGRSSRGSRPRAGHAQILLAYRITRSRGRRDRGSSYYPRTRTARSLPARSEALQDGCAALEAAFRE